MLLVFSKPLELGWKEEKGSASDALKKLGEIDANIASNKLGGNGPYDPYKELGKRDNGVSVL